MEQEREKRYLELYDVLTKAVQDALVKNLSKEEKEDNSVGALTSMAIIRIAASLAVSLNINHDAFIVGCSEMHKDAQETETYPCENELEKTNQEKTGSNLN